MLLQITLSLLILFFWAYIKGINYTTSMFLPDAELPFRERARNWKMKNRKDFVEQALRVYNTATLGLWLSCCLFLVSFFVTVRHQLLMVVGIALIYGYVVNEIRSILVKERTEAVTSNMLVGVEMACNVAVGYVMLIGCWMLLHAI